MKSATSSALVTGDTSDCIVTSPRRDRRLPRGDVGGAGDTAGAGLPAADVSHPLVAARGGEKPGSEEPRGTTKMAERVIPVPAPVASCPGRRASWEM